jgi:hypothetical protein
VEDSTEKSILQSRWQTAHDICSLFTCVFAFDVCEDGEGYDLCERVSHQPCYTTHVANFRGSLAACGTIEMGYGIHGEVIERMCPFPWLELNATAATAAA